jgi:DNA-binding transcriptional ArsR family regulator
MASRRTIRIFRSIAIAGQKHFVYCQSMNAGASDVAISGIAAAIGEPARARMLCCLLDGHARTSTELAIVAEVSPSTASVHLNRLRSERLVSLAVQGKHRYYRLGGREVAQVLEGLSVLAGVPRARFVPNTPHRLRAARTCYDHIAGTLGVGLHDRFEVMGCFSEEADGSYGITGEGSAVFESVGIDIDVVRKARRRFAYGCVDWSERRPHLGGALGAELLKAALKHRWVEQDIDSRTLSVTAAGRREFKARFGLAEIVQSSGTVTD